jgi:hypothetical protein
MPKVKQASKKKHVTKAVPVLGAAGLTFSLVGGAYAEHRAEPRHHAR